MYKSRPNLMIGFHGCDESVRNALVNNPNKVDISTNDYDWLGNGFYLWENNYERAFKWAKHKKQRGTIEHPSVVGVVYQLEYCLDLTDSAFLDIIPIYYEDYIQNLKNLDLPIPTNRNLKQDHFNDLIIRELDCAVLEHLHKSIDQKIEIEIENKGFSSLKSFDTVRGIFTEGGPVFEGSGIQSKNHIQICIRNLNCIKGFFIPRKSGKFH